MHRSLRVTDADHPRIQELSDQLIKLPTVTSLLQPIVAGIALQMLAYHCALLLKRDIDQPRNLAKSVTVE